MAKNKKKQSASKAKAIQEASKAEDSATASGESEIVTDTSTAATSNGGSQDDSKDNESDDLVEDNDEEEETKEENSISTVSNGGSVDVHNNDSEIQLLKDKISQLTLEVESKTKQLDQAVEEKTQLQQSQNGDKAQIDDDSQQDKSKIIELESKLETSEKEKAHIQENYENLLNRLSSVKTIFNKVKQSEQELAEAQEVIDKLTKENNRLKLIEDQNTELNSECDKLSSNLNSIRKDYQSQLDTLQDEKYNLENTNVKLLKRNNELKLQINEFELIKQELTMENKNNLIKIDGLLEDINQLKEVDIIHLNNKINNLQSIISSKDKEIENNSAQIYKLNEINKELNETIENLKQEVKTHDETIESLQQENKSIESLKTDLNSKQLLIGKLRHEAIILNEHLTKSLTMINHQNSSNKNVIDKELISNVLLSFLSFPRGDTKKFEALKLISALLEWNESQKITAGLSHNQNSNSSASISANANGEMSKQESFVSLWTEYLEKESSGK